MPFETNRQITVEANVAGGYIDTGNINVSINIFQQSLVPFFNLFFKWSIVNHTSGHLTKHCVDCLFQKSGLFFPVSSTFGDILFSSI